jgi:hypothetical protein
MYVDPNIVNEKMKQRQDKINTLVTTGKVDRSYAAVYVDEHAPRTTNKKMLHDAGWTDLDAVTKDNFRDVIYALKQINVNVICDGCSPDRIVSALNNIINDEITECWGGPDMQEFVEITPDYVPNV